MAITQNEHLKSKEKFQEEDFHKQEFSEPKIIIDQLESGEQLAHAVNSPMQSTPRVVQTLQSRYGNNEVKRIIQSAKAEDSVVDQSGFLNKYVTSEIQRARSGGQPLQADISQQMQNQFGKDLSNVRLHADQRADSISKKIQAKAFTIGNDIFFRKGAYSPNSEQGRHTLMHELTHVVQQSASTVSNGPLKLGDPNDKYEREAEGVAHSGLGTSRSQTGASSDTVQRFSLASLTSAVGGLFSKGSKSGSTSSPAPATEVPPTGVTQEDWKLIKKAGIADKSEWGGIDPNKQNLIKNLINSDTSKAKMLVSALKEGNWPKDGSGNDISNESDFNIITETLKIPLNQWKLISKNSQRDFLMKNAGKAYSGELARAAMNGKWPTDGSGNEILDDGIITKIKNEFGLNIQSWSQIGPPSRKSFLLNSAGGLSGEQLKELSRSALSGVWPKNGGDVDITSADDWKKIKEAFPNMSPSYWNGFDKFTRADALLASSTNQVKEVINEANFTRNSKEGAMDKIGEVSGHGATDTVLGTVGLAGSITSLSKGTGDNANLDRGGATTSAVSDAGSFLASGGSLLGSVSQLRRGSKMTTENNSQASREIGQKQKSRGRWGITQSVFGMAGSGSSFAGNVTKANDPTSDSADKASSGLGVAGGFFGMIGSALGIGKGSASLNSARKRSNLANTYVDESAVAGSDTEKLNKIATLTAKSQNKTGKSLGIFKGVTSFLGSAVGSIGSIGGLAGMSKEGGFGLGIVGAAFSGLGILGGLGQMVAESKNKPAEAELDAQADSLIALLKDTASPERLKAAKFVKEVLKINFINLSDNSTWTSWIDEDVKAAKALIKSKLSKF